MIEVSLADVITKLENVGLLVTSLEIFTVAEGASQEQHHCRKSASSVSVTGVIGSECLDGTGARPTETVRVRGRRHEELDSAACFASRSGKEKPPRHEKFDLAARFGHVRNRSKNSIRRPSAGVRELSDHQTLEGKKNA